MNLSQQPGLQGQDDSSYLRWIEAYQPPAGVYDEMIATGGALRSHWQPFLGKLSRLGFKVLGQRQEQARRQIARDGVTFDPYDPEGPVSRPWELDPLPLLMTEAEWLCLSNPLKQRARILEAVLDDLFGEQRLIRDKVLPPDFLFAHPGYHPAFHELRRPDQRYLYQLATDLARDESGKWWVTGDRTRSPFGLGYVVENRVVASRIISEAFRTAKIHRIAGFFKNLKEELRRLAPRSSENPRIVVWTKGPQSAGYSEDSYLARYLGYTLAEGGDLAVRQQRVMLKTLGGLLPVEILMRRLDDDDCDAVELNSESTVGVSGLLDVLRRGDVAIANALGTRLVESPLLAAYLPGICQYFFGEELLLESVPVWWCGQPSSRKYVLENLDQLLIREAYRMSDQPPIYPDRLTKEELGELKAKLKAQPERYVAQAAIPRSTTPVLGRERLEPWYMALRMFLTIRGKDYSVLPGALARVSPQKDVLDYTMTSGERSKDVWVLAEKEEVVRESLLAPSGEVLVPHRGGAELPSRVADNLFWLGRHMERAEQTGRMLRAVVESYSTEGILEVIGSPLVRTLVEQGQLEPDYAVDEFASNLPHLADILPSAVFDTSRSKTFRSSIRDAGLVASKVRDRLAIDMWRTIDRIDKMTQLDPRQPQPGLLEVIEILETTLAEIVAFAGLASESMTRTLGWRFLDLGCRIERSMQTVQLLRSFFVVEASVDPVAIETILRIANSLMTYRNRYLANMQVPVTLDLLITDETNPRSLIYQLHQIIEHLERMPAPENQAMLTPEHRLALSLYNSVRLADVMELASIKSSETRESLDRLLKRLQDQLPKLSDLLTSRFLTHAGLQRHFASSNEAFRHYGPAADPKATSFRMESGGEV